MLRRSSSGRRFFFPAALGIVPIPIYLEVIGNKTGKASRCRLSLSLSLSLSPACSRLQAFPVYGGAREPVYAGHVSDSSLWEDREGGSERERERLHSSPVRIHTSFLWSFFLCLLFSLFVSVVSVLTVVCFTYYCWVFKSLRNGALLVMVFESFK